MKKISLILLTISILFMFCIVVSAEILYSGNCGDNVTYTVDNEYNLVVIGEGTMWEYENAVDKNIPWKEYRSQITNISIQDGITSIGKTSFSDFNSITSILLPNSITNISNGAFLYCKSLQSAKLSQSLSIISTRLFLGCSNLNSVNFYNQIQSIENRAFEDCTSLKTVYFYGTEEEWNAIEINPEGNDALLNANIVYISEVLPTSISIDTKPIYILGEDTALDVAVNLNQNDGTNIALSPNEYTLETNFDPTAEGEYTITATYGDFTDTVTVKVEPLKMTSIAITTQPDTTEFIEGTDFDLTGMVITGTYNNGKTEIITDYTVTGYNNSSIGSQKLIISYNRLITQLPITIVKKSIIGIRIASLPNKTYYDNDETELDLTGFEVETLYNNGLSVPNINYTMSSFDGTKAGKQTITIAYSNFRDSFDVEVKRYEYKVDSTVSKQYDFDTKTLTVGTNITSRTDAGAVKMIIAVYDSNGVLMSITAKDTFFDTNETKNLSVGVENVDYPFDKVKIFVWNFDMEKMLPMAVGV